MQMSAGCTCLEIVEVMLRSVLYDRRIFDIIWSMMKRVTVILMLCILLLPPLAAYADVIFEPENDFYEQHRSRIIFLGRSFAANGDGGSVSVKKDPGARADIARLENGAITYMQYSCLYDGDFWGFTYEHSGWIKLSQMLVLYDYVAFEEYHFGELYLYDGDYAEVKETRAAIAWPWPGSGEPMWVFEDLDAESFRVAYAYRDDEGREWGFVTYLYGSRNIWVCLSDPLNSDISIFNPVPAPGVWVSDTEHIDIRQHADAPVNESSIIAVIIVLVTALVVGTAVLIRVVWKNDKHGRGTP